MKYYCAYDSPAGRLWLAQDADGLTHLTAEELPIGKDWEYRETALLQQTKTALAEYFCGTRRTFEEIRLHPAGTEKQKKAWEVLRKIPYGTTISYKKEAELLGFGSARSAGGANSKNPILILIPCHRVICADGTPGGYSSSLSKEFLLRLEGASGIKWKNIQEDKKG